MTAAPVHPGIATLIDRVAHAGGELVLSSPAASVWQGEIILGNGRHRDGARAHGTLDAVVTDLLAAQQPARTAKPTAPPT